MNVVLLSSYEAWHGGEVVLSALADGLAARGHTVTLVTRADAEIARRCARRTGIHVVQARLRGEGDPRTHAGVLRTLKASAADVLLTNLSRDLKFGAAAARWLGVPHVHRYAEVPRRLAADEGEDDGGGPASLPAARGKRVQRLLLRRVVAGVIVPSRFVREMLLRRVPGIRPVGVVPNGIDSRTFRPDPDAGLRWRADRGIAVEVPLVGCVGQLDRRRKAQQVLLHAAAAARARPVVALVGDGADAQGLRAEGEALGLRTVLTGFERDTSAAYNAFDVAAFPSRQESFGLAVAEAMACGRGVVAARAGSVAELLRDGREGWLVPPGDPRALASALDGALEDAPLRSRLGAAARLRVERELGLERMVGRYEAALEAAVSGTFVSWAAGAGGLDTGDRP